MTLYCKQWKRTQRKSDMQVRCYLDICGVYTRKSIEDYEQDFRESDGVSNLFLKETKTHWHHYTTFTFYVENK